MASGGGRTSIPPSPLKTPIKPEPSGTPSSYNSPAKKMISEPTHIQAAATTSLPLRAQTPVKSETSAEIGGTVNMRVSTPSKSSPSICAHASWPVTTSGSTRSAGCEDGAPERPATSPLKSTQVENGTDPSSGEAITREYAREPGTESGMPVTLAQKKTSTAAPPGLTPGGAGQAPRKTPNDFIFGKLIGEGSFSRVFLAKEVDSGREFAIKVCEKRVIMREHKREQVMREKDIYARLAHPFCIKLYCTFQDGDRLYFVLNLARRGEILGFLQHLSAFDEACTRWYAAEMLAALEYLHLQCGIIHRDLKPENVLLCENWHILLSDFGSAKILSPDDHRRLCAMPPPSSVSSPASTSTDTPTASSNTAGEWQGVRSSFQGTPQYVSPEILSSKPITFSADHWALGCIIYQFLSGLVPFRAKHEYCIFQKIQKLDYSFPAGFPESARDLVTNLLRIVPAERLGSLERGGYSALKQHPFFQQIDWEKLTTQDPPPLLPNVPALTGDPNSRGTPISTVSSVSSTSASSSNDTLIQREMEGTSPREESQEDDHEPAQPHTHAPPPEAALPPALWDQREAGLSEAQLAHLLASDLSDEFANVIGPGTRSESISIPTLKDLYRGLSTRHEQNEPASAVPPTLLAPSARFPASAPASTQKPVPGAALAQLPSPLATVAPGSAASATSLTKKKIDEQLLEKQRRENPFHQFVRNRIIIKQGILDKRRGLFAKRRMFLLTEGPHLFYVDPDAMKLMGEIPKNGLWNRDMNPEPKNFRVFYIYEPNRTWFLEDPTAHALDWCDAIVAVRDRYCPPLPGPEHPLPGSANQLPSSCSPPLSSGHSSTLAPGSSSSEGAPSITLPVSSKRESRKASSSLLPR